VRTIIAAVAGAYLFIAGICLAVYWSSVMATYNASVAGAAVNGALQWVTSAGNWLIQVLW